MPALLRTAFLRLFDSVEEACHGGLARSALPFRQVSGVTAFEAFFGLLVVVVEAGAFFRGELVGGQGSGVRRFGFGGLGGGTDAKVAGGAVDHCLGAASDGGADLDGDGFIVDGMEGGVDGLRGRAGADLIDLGETVFIVNDGHFAGGSSIVA